MTAALNGGQSVLSQKKFGRGWTNKVQVQDGIEPKYTFHLKSGRRSKESKAQFGWGLSLNPALLHKKQLDDPDIGPIKNGRSLVRDLLVPKYVPQALQRGTIGIAAPYYRYKMAC